LLMGSVHFGSANLYFIFICQELSNFG
jgi:hypothetical protein